MARKAPKGAERSGGKVKIYRDAYTKLHTPTVVALGCFDGVHTAHAAVIGEAVRIARERGADACVWCFSEPPRNSYLPSPVPLICSVPDKAAYIAQLGPDVMISPDFTHEIASITAERFVSELLCECAGAVHLVCGRNYTFGCGGRGNAQLLSTLCAERGISLSVLEDVYLGGEKVSSTRIRAYVDMGRCKDAARLLGRDFSVRAERTGDGTYTVYARYLSPPDGRYRALIDDGTVRGEETVTLTRTPEGCRVDAEVNGAPESVRVTFISDREDG